MSKCSIVMLVILMSLNVACAHIHVHPLSMIDSNAITLGDLDDNAIGTISIVASPDKMERSGQWVSIILEGVGSIDDIVAMYSPASSAYTPRDIAPISFKFANSSIESSKPGIRHLQFYVLNLRADVAFAFIRGGFKHPEIKYISPAIDFVNHNEPLQPRLSMTDKSPNELRLSWSSRDSDRPQVKYGRVSGVYEHIVDAISETYTREQMCGDPAKSFGWRDPGLIHHAILTHLEPRQHFFYVFGSDRTGWSNEFTLKVPAAPGADQSLNFFAFGDMGFGQKDGSNNIEFEESMALKTMEYIERDLMDYDMLLLCGDVAYAVGFQSAWDLFLQQMAPISSYIPFQTSIGNHERIGPTMDSLYDTNDSGGECGIPYQMRFPLPSGSSKVKSVYSYEAGPVHFLIFNTEEDFSPGTEQYDFIVQDLSSVDRSKTPWVVVSGHRPMYVDSTWHGDISDSQRLRAILEPLFLKWKVDIAIWGHNHTYQRMKPVFNEVIVTEPDSSGYYAPIHLMIGSAGASLTPNFHVLPPKWLAKGLITFGYGRFQVSGNRLHFEFILDKDGSIADEFTLEKPEASSDVSTM